MEAWWEVGSAGRMAPQAPGGVADWCCGCDIRRSAEAPKRRSTEAPKRRTASIAGLPLETIYLGASTCNSPRIAWLPPVAMASVVGRMGSRAWGHYSPRIAWLPPVATASVVGRMGSRAWGHYSPRIAWLPPVAMASVVGRMGSRAWGHYSPRIAWLPPVAMASVVAG